MSMSDKNNHTVQSFRELNLPKGYNLEKTLLGGQAFNWDKKENIYTGFMEDKVIFIKEENNKVFWKSYPETDAEYINRYFNLDFDYELMIDQISKDGFISNAIIKLPKLYLLKQDFNQTVLSFILSSHKNIKAVRKLVRDISKEYGDQMVIDNQTYFLFPKLKCRDKR